jgi:hypothetical protein
MRRPSLVGTRSVRDEPAADKRFPGRGAALARSRCGEVAKPGETLQDLARAARWRDAGEIELGEGDDLAADGKISGEDLGAALPVPHDMVARDRGELQRLALAAQPAEQRALRKAADDIGARAGFGAHCAPLSALMFAA